MKRTAYVLIAAAAFSSGAYAGDIDSVFKVLDSASNLMNAGAKLLESGAVLGKMDATLNMGKVTQIQNGGRSDTQELNAASVVGGKVIGVFTTRVTTGDVLQQQSGTDNRQIANLGVVR